MIEESALRCDLSVVSMLKDCHICNSDVLESKIKNNGRLEKMPVSCEELGVSVRMANFARRRQTSGKGELPDVPRGWMYGIGLLSAVQLDKERLLDSLIQNMRESDKVCMTPWELQTDPKDLPESFQGNSYVVFEENHFSNKNTKKIIHTRTQALLTSSSWRNRFKTN